MSKKPKIARGMPIGAATTDTESAMPAIIKTRPRTAATMRPVSLKKKLKSDHTMTNGSNRIGVLLRCESTAVFLSAFEKMYRQISWGATKKRSARVHRGAPLRTNPEVG